MVWGRGLWFAVYGSRVMNCGLLFAFCGCRSRVAFYGLRLMVRGVWFVV